MTEKMRAAQFSSCGKVSEVIKVVEVPRPVPKSHEVLVQVYTAGMNPINYKMVEGRLGLATPKLPCIDGLDFAGVIQELGPNCSDRLKVGDEVWGKTHGLGGSFAEYVAVPEDVVVIKPKAISFEEAGSLGVVAVTAYQALIATANLQAGQKILILNGSGGAGSFGIQLAKHVCNAYVATTCSSRNVDFVTSIGADQVINYENQNWAEVLAGANYDAIYDCIGGPQNWEDAHKVLKPDGRFMTITGDEKDTPFLTIGKLVSTGWTIAGRKIKSVFGSLKYDFIFPRPTLKQYEEINTWLGEKKIKGIIDKTFPLDNIIEAYEYQHAGHATGKIVVVIKQDH